MSYARATLFYVVALGACRGPGPESKKPLAPVFPPSPPVSAPVARALSAAAVAGRALFFDQALSASGSQSCASCHDPRRAYGPPDGKAVQMGGPRRQTPGARAVPSLRYKEYTPAWADLMDNTDGFSEPGPGGGFAWDGRADSLAEQAKLPLLSALEMANASPAQVVERVREGSSAGAFLAAFGAQALADESAAFEKVAQALQAFQLEDPSFHPYSSKYDRYLGHQGALTAAEKRGLEVFEDAQIGNCAACHFSGAGQDNGSQALFTDFSFAAIGVPRNAEIKANRAPRYGDRGVCGPLRSDHLRADEFCGLFKTPTLRNVATRQAFFHNGVIHSLEDALRFYNTRDTSPERWYPTVNGKVKKFDDLAPQHRRNIDRQMPLDGRPAGSTPPMTEQQLGDLLCFLQTLDDDYQPGPVSARCAN